MRCLPLGDISTLQEKLEPDPNLPHSFDYDERQEGVTVAYGRDRGETETKARVFSLAQLNNESNWTEYVYIFDENNKWKYFKQDRQRTDCMMFMTNLKKNIRSTVCNALKDITDFWMMILCNT